MGNRVDLEDEMREVTKEDGSELVKELDLQNHFETSALTGQNIATLFETLTKHLYIEHGNKLGEFRDDGASIMDNNRTASLSFNSKNQRTFDLYNQKPLQKKKKKCC